jgi:fibronectin-binding autotransporter adhesin
MFSIALRRTLLTLIGLVAASTASAGTITTWSGTAANNNWSTNGNWTTKPTTSGTFSLVYRGATASGTSANNIGPVTVDSILFSNNGTAGQTSNYRITTTATSSIRLTDGGTITTTAATSGTLSDTNAGTLNLLGTGTFNIGSNHNLTLTGTLTGSGSIVKTGAGDLLLSGPSSLSGLAISQGVVQFNTNSYSAINALQVEIGSAGNTGILRFNAVTGTTGAAIKMTGNATVQANGASNITFSSNTFNVADPSVTTPTTLSLIGGSLGFMGTQTIEGAIQDNSGSGTVGVTVGGPATTNVWVLKGVNTYSGPTTVSTGGYLLMDGVVSASSTTTSSGYLGGSGTFGGAVSIISGTISPGGTSTSGASVTDTIDTLTVGSLSLTSPAVTQMTVSGSTAGLYDQIVGANSSSSVSYGGTLALTLSGSYVDYTTFDLFSGFTSQSGSFSAITLSAPGTDFDGLTFTGPDGNGDWYTGWTVNNQELKFSQSTGTLTVVPEPSTIVFAGIGLAMFGWSTWTRRRAKARRRAMEAAIA